MERYVVIDKRVGETPLMALEAWKRRTPAYARVPTSYAGRLDPMASGSLLVLLGEECKQQRAYTDLDKEYEIEVLLDVGSDTGDVLGLPKSGGHETRVSEESVARALARECGAHSRAYPAFSSKTVGGKPLFLHALEGSLSQVDVPEHIERIYRIKSAGVYSLPSPELAERVSTLLARVPHTLEPSKRLGEDFRVDAISAEWARLFAEMPKRDFTVLRLRVTCASGTYMRSLAGRIGETLGTEALALSIKRTRIGKYISVLGDIGFWSHTY
jgi:tRNA pseudouridine55 synthase